MLKIVRSQGYSNIQYREFPEASVAVPVFHFETVRASLFMVYEKTAISAALLRSQYVPALRALAAQIQCHTQNGSREVPEALSPPASARRGHGRPPFTDDGGTTR